MSKLMACKWWGFHPIHTLVAILPHIASTTSGELPALMTLPRSLAFCFCVFGAASSDVIAADAADVLTPAPSERASPATPIPDRYIVQLVTGVDALAVAASHGVSPNFVYRHAVRGFAGMVPPGRLAALRSDPRVLRVTPDRTVMAIGKP